VEYQPQDEGPGAPRRSPRWRWVWGTLSIMTLVGLAVFTLAGIRQHITTGAPAPTPPRQAERQPGFEGDPLILVVWRLTREGYSGQPGVRPASGKAFLVVWVAVCNVGYRSAVVEPGDFYFETDGHQQVWPGPGAPRVTRPFPTRAIPYRGWQYGYIGFAVSRTARQGRLRYAGPLRAVGVHYDEQTQQVLERLGVPVPESMHVPRD